MDQDEARLIAVEQWHEANWADLAEQGISMTLRPRSTGRSKNSASIEFVTGVRAVSAVVWDSGEAEVLVAETSDQSAPEVRVHFVGTANDVKELLDVVRRTSLEARE
jgi:hypothetical protein